MKHLGKVEIGCGKESYKIYDVVRVISPSNLMKIRHKDMEWSTHLGIAAIQELPDTDGYCVVYSQSKKEQGKHPVSKVPTIQLRRLSDNIKNSLLCNRMSTWSALPEDVKQELIRKAESIVLLGSNKMESSMMAMLLERRKAC